MITPESAEEFLKELSGDDNRLPLFRDNNASLGLRPWTGEDSAKFCQWLPTQMDDREGDRDLLVCYEQKEVAQLLGVSVSKIQQWLRRSCHPIPHIKEGRTILIAGFLLREWLREESTPSNGKEM